MDFVPSRLRRGEMLAGAGAIALLALTFLTKWERISGRSLNGWHAATHVRWLIVVTALLALLLTFTQAMFRAPAIPVSLSVIVTVLAPLTSLWLFYRVVIDPLPHQKISAVLALLSACVSAYGAYLSLRQGGISPHDAPPEIPTVPLGAR